MLGLLSVALMQAAGAPASPTLDRPRTRIERLLDGADQAIIRAEQFSCIGSRQDHNETEALRARYHRAFAGVEQRLGRAPYRASIVADCTALDRADYWDAVHRASARLNEAERMMRQGRTD